MTWGSTRNELDPSAYDGLVAVNCRRLSSRRLRDAGFAYVRRFAAVPNLREPRWFIPLDSPAVTSAAFCLYTPFRLSAKMKLCAAHMAIRARAPVWYRDEICLAQRAAPPLEKALEALVPGPTIRLALSTGAAGPEARRKPAFAVIGAGGGQLAFGKLAGSPVARDLLGREAKVLSALATLPGVADLAPRLMFGGDVDGTYTLVQSPIEGRRVGPELTPAHQRFLEVLRYGPPRPAAESGLVATVRRLASALPSSPTSPSPRTDLMAVLDQVMPTLARLNVPVTITHADFVPWNLRRRLDGRLAAFDWDAAELDGLPLYDEVRHLTFVGHCIGRWTARQAHERLMALAASAPLGLRPAQVRALATVYLVHAILRFLMQGHDERHPVVVWHQDLLALLHAPDSRPRARAASEAPAGVLSTEAV